MRRVRTALMASLAAVTLVSAASPAGAQPSGAQPSGAQPEASGSTPGVPAGANDWSCKPSPQHPDPVVLVHGLSASAATNWATMSPALAAEGYCVFALTYGKPPGLPPVAGGFAPMQDSAAELAGFVDRVLGATGAGQVDLVGHSEGTLMPQYYLKFLGGADQVRRYVAMTPLYAGTNLHSTAELLDRLTTEIPGAGDIADELCGSCRQFFHGSDFLRRLNAGGAAVPGVTYTTIMTKYDEIVTPYTSGHLEAPNATNILLQARCPYDFSEHVAVAFDPHVTRLVRNALDPASAEPVSCAGASQRSDRAPQTSPAPAITTATSEPSSTVGASD